MNLAQQSSRAEAIASAVNDLHTWQAVGMVCRWVEDAGGVFSGLNARTAQAKVRAVLNEPGRGGLPLRQRYPVLARWISGRCR